MTLNDFHNEIKLILDGQSPMRGLGELDVLVSDDRGNQYLISQLTALKIISKNRFGFTEKANKFGNRSVGLFEGVYFKDLVHLVGSVNDSFPGYEFASASLARIMFERELVCWSALLVLENVMIPDVAEGDVPQVLLNAYYEGIDIERVFEEHYDDVKDFLIVKKPKKFVVQASRSVGLCNLHQFFEERKSTVNIDSVNFGMQFVRTLVGRPTDDKPDNYAVDYDEENFVVLGIDNDQFLGREVYHSNDSNFYSDIKSVFYVLPEMSDIFCEEVRQIVLGWSPAEIVLKWARDIYSQNQIYESISSLDRYDLYSLNLPIALPRSALLLLYHRIIDLQRILLEHENISYHNILNLISPPLGYFFEAIRNRPHGGIIEKFVDSSRSNLLDMMEVDFDQAFDKLRSYIEMSQENVSVFELMRHFLSQETKKMSINEFEELICIIRDLDFSDKEILDYILPLTSIHKISRCSTNVEFVKMIFENIPHFDLDEKDDGITVLDNVILNLLDNHCIDVLYFFVCSGAREMQKGSMSRLLNYCSKNESDLLSEVITRLRTTNMIFDWEYLTHSVFMPSSTGLSDEKITGITFSEKFISEDTQNQLDNPDFLINTGRRKVCRVYTPNRDGVLFWKFFPELPGIEYSAMKLNQLIFGDGIPSGELFRWGDMPIYVSQGIGEGMTLLDAFTENQNIEINHLSMSERIIMAILTNPEDGKPDNYVLRKNLEETYDIWCVDNDHDFLPENPDVFVKTILFCFNDMISPVHGDVIDTILNLDPEIVLKQWIYSLMNQSQRFATFFDPKERIDILEKKECILTITFQQEVISGIYLKLLLIKNAFLENREITPLEILKKLDPWTANRYEKVLSSEADPFSRFLKLDGKFFSKKGNSFQTITTSGRILATHNLPKNKKLIEDSISQLIGPHRILEYFENYLDEIQGHDFKFFFDISELRISLNFSGYSEEQKKLKWRKMKDIVIGEVVSTKKIDFAFLYGYLDPFPKRIRNNMNELVHLDLRYTELCITKLNELLNNRCPQLEYLNLQGITFTERKNFFPLWSYEIKVYLPNVEIIDLSNTRIDTLYLNTPLIKSLSLNGVCDIRKLEVISETLEILRLEDVCTLQIVLLEESIIPRFRKILKQQHDLRGTTADLLQNKIKTTVMVVDIMSSRGNKLDEHTIASDLLATLQSKEFIATGNQGGFGSNFAGINEINLFYFSPFLWDGYLSKFPYRILVVDYTFPYRGIIKGVTVELEIPEHELFLNSFEKNSTMLLAVNLNNEYYGNPKEPLTSQEILSYFSTLAELAGWTYAHVDFTDFVDIKDGIAYASDLIESFIETSIEI